MKILFVSFYYSPEIGAAPNRITSMAEGLRKSGADVDVVTCLPNYPKGEIFDGYKGKLNCVETINDITVFRHLAYATVSRRAIPRALGMMSFATSLWTEFFSPRRIMSYDLLIVQCPPLPVAVSALLLFKKIYGRKVVINISDLWPLSAIELGAMAKGSKICRFFEMMEHYVYRNADAFLGQSKEILDHIKDMKLGDQPMFLYRNVKRVTPRDEIRSRSGRLKLVYAGLLGVAQDIAGIIKQIDFEKAGVEFHLYGGGNQLDEIAELIESGKAKNVYFHGYISSKELPEVLKNYDASIVPLAVAIHGAVPSKLFDLMPQGLPVLYCGQGEAAGIIKENRLGFSSPSGDYEALRRNIEKLRDLPEKEYEQLSENCLKAAAGKFNFQNQMERTVSFLEDVIETKTSIKKKDGKKKGRKVAKQ